MSNDEWICPKCGFLNQHTIRVAMKDICVNCKEEKKTWEELEKEYELLREEIDRELDRLKEKSFIIRERINSLENDITPLRMELDTLVAQSDDLMSRRSRIPQPNRFAHRTTETGKRIFPGQKELV